ncbi:MAG TPA: NAD(+)/NADH kinase [Caldisericia bacterium]|nr:NAD(+)/NADH kinase [Caldisericia bacterium]HPF49239.1 NAD(+)/NADH kinase [Caldisericia bacterium]HPI84081.1 NAD(+)/NADH kinase [Caldisericia bacterium]HPQ93339.1 NAD(+)/NADH kinase [Caldisericia bacterium]HRV75279.1 NAD(+)/NADH kinase [Caldisericia bacterium]
MKIGLFFRKNSEQVLRTSLDAANWLESHNVEVSIPTGIAERINVKPDIGFPEGCEMILSLGGDGTLLRATRVAAPHGIPVIGINLGNMGFLTEIEQAELHNSLQKIFRKEYTIETRTMVRASVLRFGKEIRQIDALNDIYFHRDIREPLVSIVLYVDSEWIGKIRADGLIVSTTTGSTAYALSAGGAVVDPECDVMEIVPICPHKINQKPIIVPLHKKVTLEFTSPDLKVSLIADGDNIEDIEPYDVVIVSRSDFDAKLVRFKEKNFYNILRSAFDWSK